MRLQLELAYKVSSSAESDHAFTICSLSHVLSMPQDHSWCDFGGRESHGGRQSLDGLSSLQSAARTLPALREPQQELDVAAKPSPSFSRARNDACARYQAQSFAALKSKILRDDAAHNSRRGRVAAAPRTNRVEDA